MFIGIPQMIYLIIATLSLTISICNHGKPRSKENALTSFISIMLGLGLLWWGGFFK